MSTTMLERTNPLEQLRPRAGGREGVARRMLAELDDEVTEIFGILDPAALTPILPVSEPRQRLRDRLRPARRAEYPVTWNLPKPRPLPRISVQRVPRPGPARPTEMPRSLTWLPMLRGAVNAMADSKWRAWLSGWDRTIVLQRRLCRAKAEAAGVAFRIKEEILAEKTMRTINFFTRAVWEDYLSVFGTFEGTPAAHIVEELDRLGMLAAA